MDIWMWGGDGIHSLESIRAKWEVGWGKKLTLESKSQSVGFQRKVFLSVWWLAQWGKGPGSLKFIFLSESTSPPKGRWTRKGVQKETLALPGDVWGLEMREHEEWYGRLEDRKKFSGWCHLSFLLLFSAVSTLHKTASCSSSALYNTSQLSSFGIYFYLSKLFWILTLLSLGM